MVPGRKNRQGTMVALLQSHTDNACVVKVNEVWSMSVVHYRNKHVEQILKQTSLLQTHIFVNPSHMNSSIVPSLFFLRAYCSYRQCI